MSLLPLVVVSSLLPQFAFVLPPLDYADLHLVFFGYDSGYMGGCLAMPQFIHVITGLPIPSANASAAETAAFVIPASKQSLIVSILSAGTFFGCIIAGDLADYMGRRFTVILGCIVFIIGNILQTATQSLALVCLLVFHFYCKKSC